MQFLLLLLLLSSIVEMYDIKKMTHSMICVTQCGVYLREIINKFVRLIFSSLGFTDPLSSELYWSSQLWALLIFSALGFIGLLRQSQYEEPNTYQKNKQKNNNQESNLSLIHISEPTRR